MEIEHWKRSYLVYRGHFAWGVFFKDPSLLGIILVVAIMFFITTTAKVEERENVLKFGADYAEYMKKTKMFVPFVF